MYFKTLNVILSALCSQHHTPLILSRVQVIKFNEGMVGWKHARLLPLSCDNADDREGESHISNEEKVNVV